MAKIETIRKEAEKLHNEGISYKSALKRITKKYNPQNPILKETAATRAVDCTWLKEIVDIEYKL